MEIEWDNNKAASNLIKHKIDFEETVPSNKTLICNKIKATRNAIHKNNRRYLQTLFENS